MLFWLGWAGNCLLLISVWRLGSKDRNALLIGALGGTLWAIKAAYTNQVDLFLVNVVLSIVQLISWFRWGK